MRASLCPLGCMCVLMTGVRRCDSVKLLWRKAHAFTLVVRKVNRTRYVKVCKIRGLPKATYEVCYY